MEKEFLIKLCVNDTGCLGLVHWDDPEGWYGEGGGFRMGNRRRRVRDGEQEGEGSGWGTGIQGSCIPVVDSF